MRCPRCGPSHRVSSTSVMANVTVGEEEWEDSAGLAAVSRTTRLLVGRVFDMVSQETRRSGWRDVYCCACRDSSDYRQPHPPGTSAIFFPPTPRPMKRGGSISVFRMQCSDSWPNLAYATIVINMSEHLKTLSPVAAVQPSTNNRRQTMFLHYRPPSTCADRLQQLYRPLQTGLHHTKPVLHDCFDLARCNTCASAWRLFVSNKARAYALQISEECQTPEDRVELRTNNVLIRKRH